MPSWEDVQTRKVEMQNEAVASLTKEERNILRRVLELEMEHRPLVHTAAASEIRKVSGHTLGSKDGVLCPAHKARTAATR